MVAKVPEPEPISRARASLRELGRVLRRTEELSRGELAAEARLAWLYSLHPLHDPEQLAETLRFVSELECQVDNWSDCFGRPEHKNDEEEERFITDAVEPAQKAAHAALHAVIDVCDWLRNAHPANRQ
jgi:hypothetical protein